VDFESDTSEDWKNDWPIPLWTDLFAWYNMRRR
jgi:hypothetical protein